MMAKIDDYMDEYYDRFNDIFPTFNFQTESTDKLIERVKECLDKDIKAEKLYGFDYSDDTLY